MTANPLHQTEDYTIAGNIVTFVVAPVNTQWFEAHYSYREAGQTLHTHTRETRSAWAGGATWTLTNTPQDGQAHLFAGAVPPDRLLAINSADNHLWRYNGTTWADVFTPTSFPTGIEVSTLDPNVVSLHNADQDGGADTIFAYSLDAGVTWVEKAFAPAGLVNPRIGATFPDKAVSARVWALCYSDQAGVADRLAILYTDDYGTTWTESFTALATVQWRLGALEMSTDGQTIYAAVRHFTGADQTIRVYRTVNGGGAWTLVEATVVAGVGAALNTWLCVDPATNTHVLLDREGGPVRETVDGGTTWTTLQAGGSYGRFAANSAGVIITNNLTTFLVARTVAAGVPFADIVDNFGGNFCNGSWYMVCSAGRTLVARLYAFDDTNGRIVYRSIDGGVTWTLLTDPGAPRQWISLTAL